ncbi:MAG: peptidylprolyl isomerase [Clostridia bacterium]|nr:peptidylprolyl isomerase [Clostridia bacterium]
MKKILSLILSVIMIIGLSACGTATMEEINKNTNITVATIGDEDIYAYEMIYLMKMGYPKEDALNEISSLKASVAKAKEHNVTLTEEDDQTIASQFEELATQFGSEDALLKEFENLGITKEQYQEIMRLSLMVEHLNEQLVELGIFSEVEDDVVLDFYNNNFLRAQHILFSTVDPQTNAKLSDDVIKQKKAQAEDIAKQISQGKAFEDFVSLSEDPGLEASPNGYTFLNAHTPTIEGNELMLTYFQQSGIPIMVESFEKATAELGNNEVSDVIDSDFGYHIIKRYDLHGENNEYEVLKPYIAGVINNVNYTNLVNGWKEQMKQKTNKYYEALEVTPANQTATGQTAQPQEDVADTE